MKLTVVNEKYYVVHRWMVNELNLRGLNLTIYAIIYGYSMDGETEFFGSLNYLTEMTGCTKQAIIKSLKYLVENEYIVRVDYNINNIKTVHYKANVTKFNGGKQSLMDGKQSLPNKQFINNIIYNNNNKNKQNNIPSPETSPETVENHEDSSAFDLFWKAYPKKSNKAYAKSCFPRAMKRTTLEIILEAIEKQKTYKDWLSQTGQFVPTWPDPSTWLNNKRWEDDAEILKNSETGEKSFDHDDLYYRAAVKLNSSVTKRYPTLQPKTEKELQEWANEFYLCEHRDKHPIEEISEVLKYSQTDSFWREKIRDAKKFRCQYENLLAGKIESERRNQ